MTAETVTILKCRRGNNLAKKYVGGGKLFLAYGNAKSFGAISAKIKDIYGMYKLIAGLQSKPRCCIIRGEYVGAEAAAGIFRGSEPAMDNSDYVRRWGEAFPDVDRRWLAVDVDGYTPQEYDPVTDPEGAISEFIADRLTELAGVTLVYQLSSRAGFVPGVLKVHLWFYLETSATSAELRRWAKSINSRNPGSIDEALYSSVQIHYTANPIFPAGVIDPIQKRVGLCRGAVDVATLSIPQAPAKHTATTETDGRDMNYAVIDIPRLKAAAVWIPDDRTTWVKAGIAYKALTPLIGGHAAFQLWMEYCAAGSNTDKNNDPKHSPEGRWSSFAPTMKPDAAQGVLFGLARDAAASILKAELNNAELSARGRQAAIYLAQHHRRAFDELRGNHGGN